MHLHHAATPHAAWFVQSFPVLSAVALIYGIAMISRPAMLRGGTTPAERARMHELVHACGFNPLAPYAPRETREFLYEHLDHLYNYRSLQRFQDKFNPRWEERFLAYPATVPLATVIAALARVHLAPRRRAKGLGRLTLGYSDGYSVPTRMPA